MADLTQNQALILRTAASAKLGVVECPYLPGFEGVTWDRNAKKLCERGYLKPYVHGGFEITDAGRATAGVQAGFSDEDRYAALPNPGVDRMLGGPAKPTEPTARVALTVRRR